MIDFSVLAKKSENSGKSNHSSKNKPEHKKEHHLKKTSEGKKVHHHKSEEKKDFKYPEISMDKIKEKMDAGFKFKQATDEDFKNKNVEIYTIKLPKNGPIPFKMYSDNTKTIDGTDKPAPVSLSNGKVQAELNKLLKGK